LLSLLDDRLKNGQPLDIQTLLLLLAERLVQLRLALIEEAVQLLQQGRVGRVFTGDLQLVAVEKVFSRVPDELLDDAITHTQNYDLVMQELAVLAKLAESFHMIMRARFSFVSALAQIL